MTSFRAFVLVCGLTFLAGCSSDSETSTKGINSILGGQIVNGVQPNDTNIRKPGTIQSVQIGGRDAIRLVVRYEDEGGKLDWYKFGRPGHAQRIQFHERRPGKGMKLGEEYWYRISFFTEPIPATRDQVVTMFDIKPIFKAPSGRTHPGSPIFGSEFSRGDFRLFDSIGSRYDCGEFRNANGSYNMFCDRVINTAALGRQSAFLGRWVEVVLHMKWADDQTGFFRYWVDGKNRYSFAGDTARGASVFEFKFGATRHHMVGPQPPLAISFSDVIRSQSCDGLGISNCSQLDENGAKSGRRNIQALDSSYFPEFTELNRDPTSDGTGK